MKKRIMVVGATQSGKSTLINALNDSMRPLKKTQDVIYGKNTIDTPGSYIENPSMYRYLIATAQAASHVLMLLDQSRSVEVYPPGFAKVFRCQVIGVITKSDLVPENAILCRQQLKRMGICEPYFSVCIEENESIGALKDHLLNKETREES